MEVFLEMRRSKSTTLRHLAIGQTTIDVCQHLRQVNNGVDHIMGARIAEHGFDSFTLSLQLVSRQLLELLVGQAQGIAPSM